MSLSLFTERTIGRRNSGPGFSIEVDLDQKPVTSWVCVRQIGLIFCMCFAMVWGHLRVDRGGPQRPCRGRKRPETGRRQNLIPAWRCPMERLSLQGFVSQPAAARFIRRRGWSCHSGRQGVVAEVAGERSQSTQRLTLSQHLAPFENLMKN